jgi:hypothetical protein
MAIRKGTKKQRKRIMKGGVFSMPLKFTNTLTKAFSSKKKNH